ncbi:MAG: CHASE2 domain-containing protein [Cyanobacteriota bacterium]|nr:CHASE2 domain-containing protein [Cyanobacteriota bacterium]
MGKSVILRFEGDFETQGFRVYLEVRSSGGQLLFDKQGYLPPAPDLSRHLKYHWTEKYRDLAAPYRLKPQAIIRGGIQERIRDCQSSAQELKESISHWLDADTFRVIDKRLREELNKDEEIQVLIRTNNPNLKKLPLHLWDFFESYQKAEIAFSPDEVKRSLKIPKSSIHSQVKILVILGHKEGINLEKDLEIIQSLPHVSPVVLVEPKATEITDQIWGQAWDIIFFAGHSETKDEEGRIYINPKDSLTTKELWYGLRKAVEKGLKLAIFNSCDGLGLTHELDDLNIPQMIVMRELVPDRIAQEFLKYFLTNFSAGQPLYVAVREARERLHDNYEREFPCASWLPVIFQNPAYVPPSWQDLAGYQLPKTDKNRLPIKNSKEDIQPEKFQPLGWRELQKVLVSAIAVTGLVWGVRSLGGLQPWELKAYDHLMQMQPNLAPDERLLLVTITENDVRSQDPEERKGTSLSDRSLALLLQKLESYQPRVIGLHLLREIPVQPQYKALSNFLETNDRFMAICRYGVEEPGVFPPPEVPVSRQGFINVLPDVDGVIRRNLLSVGSSADCPTQLSFAWRLAERYLADENIQRRTSSNNRLKLGKTTFNILEQGSGAYQTALDWRGHQIMLNYRTSAEVARQVTLSDVLAGNLDPEWIRDRIVIIGTTAPSFNDHHWLTPYSSRKTALQKITGTELQAHHLSQILSIVLDDQPLIWWFPDWGECVWILSWSILAGLITGNVRSPRTLFIIVGIGIIMIYGCCWVFFYQGGWIPLVPSVLVFLLTSGCVYLQTEKT